MTIEAQQSRVDALIGCIGVLIILVFGLALVYYTYSNANGQGIAPEIITMNYASGCCSRG